MVCLIISMNFWDRGPAASEIILYIRLNIRYYIENIIAVPIMSTVCKFN